MCKKVSQLSGVVNVGSDPSPPPGKWLTKMKVKIIEATVVAKKKVKGKYG